jgi:ABC-type iron transport system FetAB ATPase subunit
MVCKGKIVNHLTVEELEIIKKALIYAGNTVNVLWVSHHANRADFAMESVDKAITLIDKVLDKKEKPNA